MFVEALGKFKIYHPIQDYQDYCSQIQSKKTLSVISVNDLVNDLVSTLSAQFIFQQIILRVKYR